MEDRKSGKETKKMTKAKPDVGYSQLENTRNLLPYTHLKITIMIKIIMPKNKTQKSVQLL